MHRFCIRGVAISAAALLLSGILLAESSHATSPAAGSSEYVGAETCKSCHEEVFNGIQRTPHSKAHWRQNGAEAQACEACHGPGAEHVASGGDVSKIFSFKHAATNEINRHCLTCHAREHEHSSFNQSAHARGNLSCVSCHSAHHSKEREALLTLGQPELCYSCHSETRAEFSMEFRHRVNEGLIRCGDCHNVHAATLQSVRRGPELDQVCYKCHRQLQGPFMFEHVPVKTEGCISCHNPHGSLNPRMLNVYPVNLLCLQCHTPSVTPNTKTGDGNNVGGTPASPVHDQTTKFQGCTICHVFIHGSNADETFMK